ncbi:MAG TPA: site-specific DNA-methyltransferase [Candidatus Saccharimonadales bacterium]|nr:site-specific DNA-methyltransferase [Candidatus Saccharimonadales bacterium]
MNNYVGKDDILKELQQRVEDKILEPSNYDLLKKLVENAGTLDEAIKIAELGTTYRRTGFHFDKKLEKQSDTISYFKKNKELSFTTDPDAITHKLIIGDNYPALLNLLVEYKGKIDVIYIDPPYGKDSMGEFAQTNYENAISRDNLLSMLYPRLWLAKQLLSDTGVIFCSIDDRNQAYLKGLFDEVFGESNFVANFIVIRAEGGGLAKQAVIGHDYLLTYARNTQEFRPLGKDKDIRGRIIEKDGEQYWIETDWLRKEFGKYGTCLYEEIEKYLGKKKKDEVDLNIQNGNYVLIKKDAGHIVGRYRKIADDSSKFYTVIKHLNKNGVNELAELELPFDYPKPLSLVKAIVYGATRGRRDSVILDFFAGSGTTGHAILELNKDGGNRQFILVTNNEVTDINPKGIAYDVTSRRLKKVMTGEDYNGENNFKWLEKNKPYGDNLLVVDLAEVSNREAIEGKTAFDVIDETLYGQEKLDVNEKIKWVATNFEQTQKRLEEK